MTAPTMLSPEARRVLRAVRMGRPGLPASVWALRGMGELARAGLVEVQRDARGNPVRWVPTAAGREVEL